MTTQPRVLALVLAGGEGKRLMPLTADRAKPAVPFGGSYRLVDFVLSNLVNAGYLRIGVLTQFKSHSLDRHITTSWPLSPLTGDYITPVPAQQRLGPRWYSGSADAILQSLNLVHDEDPAIVLVFGADHVYRMDPRQMVEHHLATGAGLTVAVQTVPREQAHAFGVVQIEPGTTRIARFCEKPVDPPTLPSDPDRCLVSMGNYVFTTATLIDALRADAADEASIHDLGTNIVPLLVAQQAAHVYRFEDNVVPGATARDHGYWRDVGTLDSYHDANMDLVSIHPVFNLYNREWPILTTSRALPPAKFVGGGVAHESIVGPGAIIAGAHVRHSVVAASVRIEPGAFVEGSVLMDGVYIGRNAVVRRAILDKGVVVSENAQIGVDPVADAISATVSPGGVVAVGKGIRVVT
ncbi:MAG: glucose-1-phosphate adenylyltransferase [Actinomycetales bacterium]|nr:glucose-1-phosphate adenylyltransferase [Actinomycetales bacterium]